jgi:hypothetical protein
MIEVNNFVLIPEGNLTQKMNSLIACMIYCKKMNFNFFTIWNHPIDYNNLFINDIKFVSFEYLKNKNYIYQPDVKIESILTNLSYKENDNYIILHIKNPFKHHLMSEIEYMIRRKNIYENLLRNDISGILLGKLNLINIPSQPVVGVFGEYETKKNKFTDDLIDLDFSYDDAKDYLRILLFSKCDIIVYAHQHINNDLKIAIEAASIRLIPIVFIHDIKIPNTIENYFGFKRVLYPNIEKLLILS